MIKENLKFFFFLKSWPKYLSSILIKSSYITINFFYVFTQIFSSFAFTLGKTPGIEKNLFKVLNR